MATPKTKKTTIKTWGRKPVRAVVLVVVAILLVGQVCLDVHFWRAASYSSSEPITSMIIEAASAVNKPAVVEPTSKKVYLPDANLVLPPTPQSLPSLLYAYSPSFDGTDAEANVTVTNAVSVGVSKLRNAEGQGLMRRDSRTLFTAVPDLQVCVRGVHVVFGSKTTYDKLQFTKTLADGRTMHVYTEAKSCAYNLQPLVEYLRGAQSY